VARHSAPCCSPALRPARCSWVSPSSSADSLPSRRAIACRYPVVINSNPFVAWHPHPDRTKRSQASRAAGLVHKMLLWRQGMQRGLVEPDGPADPPDRRLCMSEYDRLFCTSRIPVVGGPDHHLTEPSACHVVVLRGSKFYRLDVVAVDGRIASEAVIEAAIANVLSHPLDSGGGTSIATLTAADRDHWGGARDALCQTSPRNAQALHTIESAILHLCLDSTTPGTPTAHYETFLHGGASCEPR
jgi:hypothetical protein